MEEKDVTFNIFTDDDNVTHITSDIDDCPEYLDINEKIILGLKLLSDAFAHIIKDGEDAKLNKDTIVEQLEGITTDTIQAVLNLGYTTEMLYQGEMPEILEYSLCAYDTKETINGIKHYLPLFTQHSSELLILDPIQASYAFFIDVIETLSETKNKKDVSNLMRELLKTLSTDIQNIINDCYE